MWPVPPVDHVILEHISWSCRKIFWTTSALSAFQSASSSSSSSYPVLVFTVLRLSRTPGVGNTWQRLTLVLREFLSNGLTPFRLHIVISFLTHADYVFLGLPWFLVPGSPNRVMELMHEVARCTCPYHLRCRVRRTAVISSRSSFRWSTAEEISSSSFVPQIHLIMARSFLRSRCRSEAFGGQVSLPWSIVDRTQAVNTLPRILKEMCFEVRIGNSFLNLPQAAQQRAAIVWSQPPPAENMSPR